MVRFHHLSALSSWFVVLPDDDAGSSVAIALRDHAAQQLSHASGRPWLLGCWAEGAVTTGQAGDTRIAVMGQHAVMADDLARAADAARRCDLLLAVGSTLSVYPVADMVPMVRMGGALVVIVNGSETAMDHLADAVLRGSISEVLTSLVEGTM
jgi:asparagine synthase (glutamine-hydrolysing)